MKFNGFLQFIAEPIYDFFKYPKKLKMDLARMPSIKIKMEIPHKVACSHQIIRWDQWQEDYYDSKYKLGQNTGDIPELECLTVKEINPNWSCDIGDVAGLSASKADLRKFKTLDDFAISTSFANEITEDNFHKNLAWENRRIITDPYFKQYGWDNNRVHLSNSGGSHHFAAARYLAGKLSKKVTIKGKLVSCKLSPVSVRSLLNKFNLHAVPSPYGILIIEQCWSFKVAYGVFRAPRPFVGVEIIFLPKQNKGALAISSMLEKNGVFNFGQLLSYSLKQQEMGS